MGDILGKKNFSAPDEIEVIKTYVFERFEQTPSVTLTDSSIIIVVSSASLAGALRPELHKLQEQLNTQKRLTIRIG